MIIGTSQLKTGLAVVTGASCVIGFEHAKIAAYKGYDLIVAVVEDGITDAAAEFRTAGVSVDALIADLSTIEGVGRLLESIEADGRSVDLLLANAGRGLGKGFLDQDFAEVHRVIETNVIGTVYLIQQIGIQMRTRGVGRILITGSIAGFIPGSYQPVYNGSKAFLNSFSFTLRNELNDSGVTVTCLMPGPTDTRFFERAGMLDTDVGQAEKDDPADVAKVGFDAMLNEEGDVVAGWKNKFQAAMANVTPASIFAAQHAKMASPGTGGTESFGKSSDCCLHGTRQPSHSTF